MSPLLLCTCPTYNKNAYLSLHAASPNVTKALTTQLDRNLHSQDRAQRTRLGNNIAPLCPRHASCLELVAGTATGVWEVRGAVAQPSLQPEDQCGGADRASGRLRAVLWSAHTPVCRPSHRGGLLRQAGGHPRHCPRGVYELPPLLSHEQCSNLIEANAYCIRILRGLLPLFRTGYETESQHALTRHT